MEKCFRKSLNHFGTRTYQTSTTQVENSAPFVFFLLSPNHFGKWFQLLKKAFNFLFYEKNCTYLVHINTALSTSKHIASCKNIFLKEYVLLLTYGVFCIVLFHFNHFIKLFLIVVIISLFFKQDFAWFFFFAWFVCNKTKHVLVHKIFHSQHDQNRNKIMNCRKWMQMYIKLMPALF